MILDRPTVARRPEWNALDGREEAGKGGLPDNEVRHLFGAVSHQVPERVIHRPITAIARELDLRMSGGEEWTHRARSAYGPHLITVRREDAGERGWVRFTN